MTSKQRIAILADWWPKAADANHWPRNDRSKRLDIISQAVGRTITTMNDLDNAKDIDQVKAHLLALADNLHGAVELTPSGADYGYRRRLFWLIRTHALPLGGDPYIWQLCRDKFHFAHGWNTIEDLTTHQLHQLMITLNARKHSKAKSDQNASLTSQESFPDDCEYIYAGHENDDNQPF